MKMTGILALHSICCGALVMSAQQRATAQFVTNVTAELRFNLTGEAQSLLGDGSNDPSSTFNVRVDTHNVIHALGIETANTFTVRSKLLVVFDSSGGMSFVVRDVRTNFVGQTIDYPIPDGRITLRKVGFEITSAQVDKTGVTTLRKKRNYDLVINTSELALTIRGYTMETDLNRGTGTPLPYTTPSSLATTAGAWARITENGTDFVSVLRGTFGLTARKVEVTAP